MKIALCTLYGNANLGNKLQNYALVRLSEGSSNEVDTIVTHLTNREVAYRVKSEFAVFLSRIGVKQAKQRAILWEREKRLQEFSEKYLNITQRVKFDECDKLSDKYDLFITGSDQVWHKWPCYEKTTDPNIQLKYFYLMFAAPEKRISFAPSFGFEKFPDEDVKIHRQGLTEIKYLSCREKSAQNLIRELVGRDAILLPDPTLCLSASEWCTIEHSPQRYNLPKRFILVYFLGTISEERQRIFVDIANRFDAEIINIFDVHHKDGIHNSQYYLTNPDEFIYLVHNAEFVLTDSFHACVFSIIFHKKFLAFKREEQHMEKMFGRIENLINITGINNCVYDNQLVDDMLQRKIDYIDVDKKINILAKEARTYLNSALSKA